MRDTPCFRKEGIYGIEMPGLEFFSTTGSDWNILGFYNVNAIPALEKFHYGVIIPICFKKKAVLLPEILLIWKRSSSDCALACLPMVIAIGEGGIGNF